MKTDVPALALQQRNSERDGLHLFTVRTYSTLASQGSWSGFVRFKMRLLATNEQQAVQLAYSRLKAWNESSLRYEYADPDAPVIETIDQEPDNMFEVDQEVEVSGDQR